MNDLLGRIHEPTSISPTPDPRQALNRCKDCNGEVTLLDLVYRREVVHIGSEIPATCRTFGHLVEATGNIHYVKEWMIV